jgi:ABC-type transport system involved in multi-copper enzyme maturation permease subunit
MLMTWIVLGSGILYTLGVVVLILALLVALPEDAETGLPDIESADSVRLLVTQGTTILAFLLVLGALLITTEYRHQTITSAFLVSPRRGRVVTAKFAVGGVVGLLGAAVSAAGTLAIMLSWLAIAGVEIADVERTVLLPSLGLVIAGLGFGLIGVGLGALVRNQIAAIVIGLAWVAFLDPIIGLALPTVGKYTPGGAVGALTNGVGFNTSGFDPDAYLPMWAGALLLLGYAVVITVIAYQVTVKRDVT